MVAVHTSGRGVAWLPFPPLSSTSYKKNYTRAHERNAQHTFFKYELKKTPGYPYLRKSVVCLCVCVHTVRYFQLFLLHNEPPTFRKKKRKISHSFSSCHPNMYMYLYICVSHTNTHHGLPGIYMHYYLHP